ncbi:MAG: signal peptide peptidase SppA [Candidatus Micrarchaeia archaeon]|jgi:protease-4
METKTVLLAIVLLIAAVILVILPGIILLSGMLPQPACVGVIPVNGELVTQDTGGAFSAGLTSSDTFSELVAEANSRPEIKSVLFEINSGGGSVVASSEMYSTAKNLKKPKLMFFREVGASGAYYLAMGGDEVMSDPGALTGSIGARVTTADLSGLFGNLGISLTNVKSGEFKDMGDPSRPPTEAELAMLQAIVDQMFGDFKQVVIDSRRDKANFTLENFDTVTDGRILSGKQAFALGLVDSLGNKQNAVTRAARMGGIKDAEPRICLLSKKTSFMDVLFSSSASSLTEIFSKAFKSALPTGGVEAKLQ